MQIVKIPGKHIKKVFKNKAGEQDLVSEGLSF
jgi:hypothetical protein